MRLLLINPRSSRRAGLNLHNGGYFQPLSLATLAGVTPDAWEVIVEDENWTPATMRTDVDLVGLTAFTSSIPRAYELSAFYRHEGIPTVLGGVHALACQHEAIRYFDSVVLREADVVWPQLLNDFTRSHQLKSFYMGGLVHESDFALPNRSVLDSRYRYGSIQVSRGCPMSCDFCSVPLFSGHTIRRQLPERTLQDLSVVENRGIFFVDDNLIGYGERDRTETLAMLRQMTSSGFNKPWMCQCSINVTTDDQVLEAMFAAGCRLVMIGIEANDSAGLASVRKTLNRKFVYDFSRVQKAGMAVLGFFILGLETDTPESMMYRMRAVHASGVDCWQITVLTPLPGTRLFDRLYKDDRLLYTAFPHDWGNYDFVDATFVPEGFECLEHFRECLATCSEFVYSDAAIKAASARTWELTKNHTATIMAMAANEKYGKVAKQRLAEEGFCSTGLETVR